ncbi:MAG: hypothetical protein ACLFQF_11100, partial [Rhodosalinus sp.]
MFEDAARRSLHGIRKEQATRIVNQGLAKSGFDLVERACRAQGVPRAKDHGTPPEESALMSMAKMEQWQPVG